MMAGRGTSTSPRLFRGPRDKKYHVFLGLMVEYQVFCGLYGRLSCNFGLSEYHVILRLELVT